LRRYLSVASEGRLSATLTNRRTTMKTMFLTLAAVVGLALGTASLMPAAHASQVYLYQPTDHGQG
jgi:hypothetical protein